MHAKGMPALRQPDDKEVIATMILVIASGKGGTGKTTISTNLAFVLGDTQFIDCDVEEPNAHLFLKPEIHVKRTVGLPVPVVDESRCTGCGKCEQVCEFNAVIVIQKKVMIFPELCHGCGACEYFCPEKAISEKIRDIGIIEKGTSGGIDFIHGILNVGEPMAPPLIRAVKACIDPKRIVIIDAPPGTACPVVETVKNADFCVLVTEPTPFGLNDLKLAVEMVRKLAVPMGVVINSCTIGDNEVSKYCEEEGIPILMTFPWDRRIAEQYSAGRLVLQNLREYRENYMTLIKNIKLEIAGHETADCN
jgi:MinD superfamily P-loop ATPase